MEIGIKSVTGKRWKRSRGKGEEMKETDRKANCGGKENKAAVYKKKIIFRCQSVTAEAFR